MIRKISFLGLAALVHLNANACDKGAFKDLARFWQEFREVSLKGTPDRISNYYVFPIELGGLQEGDKPISVSKKIFLKYYDVLFRVGMSGEERFIYRRLKQTSNEDLKKKGVQERFDGNGCSKVADSETAVGDYQIIWKKNTGWKVKGVSTLEDYEDIVFTYKYWGIKR